MLEVVSTIVAGIGLLIAVYEFILRNREKRQSERLRKKVNESIFRESTEFNIKKLIPGLLWLRKGYNEIHPSIKNYYRYLIHKYQYLDFKGMGITDRIPLKLSLEKMYVSLRARAEMPGSETWDRDLKVAGRSLKGKEDRFLGFKLGEPVKVFDLLLNNKGLIILGDPGAGKTTFLKYVVLQLARGEIVNKELSGYIPFLISMSTYAKYLDEQDISLIEFLKRYYKSLGTDLNFDEIVDESFAAGKALLLLDGLDEVKDVSKRLYAVNKIIDFFAIYKMMGNRFLLTSRIVGYRDVRPVVEHLTECTLVDFEEEDIECYVDQWISSLEEASVGNNVFAKQEAQDEKKELLDNINRNMGVRRLATNPLLLTILVLMKRQGISLPERRVELYQKYVEALTSYWNLARSLDRPSNNLVDFSESIQVLAPLAYWMHEQTTSGGVINIESLREKVLEIYVLRGGANPSSSAERFLRDTHEFASLLVERGPGEYGFIHLTFQEYLAGVAIAQKGQENLNNVIYEFENKIKDENWKEVLHLALGFIGIIQHRDEAASTIIKKIIANVDETKRNILFVGKAVLDMLPGGVTPSAIGSIKENLVLVLDAKDSHHTVSSDAGIILAKLGDPRVGVGLSELGVPDIAWVSIPEGEFILGDDGSNYETIGDEFPKQQISVKEFLIAKYPITNIQFDAFVLAGGYLDRGNQFWLPNSIAWRDTIGIPPKLGGNYDLPNHPKTMISWFEAMAYCNWLTYKMRILRKITDDEVIALPSELQWEKSARGADGRLYPFGNKINPGLANYIETQINSTTAVGVFSGGESVYGVSDMSGNIWEWTTTKYQESYKDILKVVDLIDDKKGNEPRSIRGGSFHDQSDFLRCSARNWCDPDIRIRDLGFRVCLIKIGESPKFE